MKAVRLNQEGELLMISDCSCSMARTLGQYFVSRQQSRAILTALISCTYRILTVDDGTRNLPHNSPYLLAIHKEKKIEEDSTRSKAVKRTW